MGINWISARDHLPPPGQFVLLRHRYRLAEYDSPYSVGVRLPGHDYITWPVSRLREYSVGDTTMTRLDTHAICPGNNYITHWAEIDDPPQGMTQNERMSQ